MKRKKDCIVFNAFNIKSPSTVFMYLLILILIVLMLAVWKFSIIIILSSTFIPMLVSPYKVLIHQDGSVESRSLLLRIAFFSGDSLVRVSPDEKKNMVRIEDHRGVVYWNIHEREQFLTELKKILPEVVEL